MKHWNLIALALVIPILVWYWIHSKIETPAATAVPTNLPVAPAAIQEQAPEPSIPGKPRRAVDAEPEVAAEFEKITLMFRNFRTLAGENPVGTNAEIMQSMMGGNPKNAQFGPPEGQQLNAEGELLDPWGTPYFFHQLGKDQMEIFSAGPDRRRGTGDDLVSD